MPRKNLERETPIDYRSLAERAPAILYRYRFQPDPAMEYINPAVTETLGYSPDDFYADPDLVRTMIGEASLLSTEPAPDIPGSPIIRRWQRRDGTYADVEDRRMEFRKRDGRLAAIEGVARDVTAELANRRELRDSRARLDALVSHVPVILWATDVQGRLTDLDGTGLRSLPMNADDAFGLTPADLHRDAARYRRHFLLALRGRPQSVEVRLGDHTFMTWLGPRVDPSGTIVGVTGVSTDVSHERRLERALASDGRERASVVAALGDLDPSDGLDDLAAEISAAVTMLEGIDHAGIVAFGPGVLTYVMALAGPELPLDTGRALPSARSIYLREHAEKGPWLERWVPRAADGRYGLALDAAGLRAAAYVPLRRGTALLGLLAVGSRHEHGAELLGQWMSALAEFGALTVGLIGGALATSQQAADVRQELLAILQGKAFSSVFQPIVGLADRSPFAFEALTRFHDGSPPDRRLVEAEAVGMGIRLEAAMLTMALKSLRLMPTGTALALNVSPAMILEGRILKRLLGPIRQAITLEVTEHRQVQDYEGVREALRDLPATIGLAIDDAGAGFASLRHVIELRPDYVKLDRGLVAGLDGDLARRAVVAGMVQFARSAGCALIAEGVETEAEHETLLQLGVEYGQGHLYGRPSTIAQPPAGMRRSPPPLR